MATSSVTFKSRKEHRKQIEFEKARKAGLASAEVDGDGNVINPHIPGYVTVALGLANQRNWKSAPNCTDKWYDRGATTFQADGYRNGAC
ncbi:hypothetical protein TIFTF001_010266 [Ficus carica]|uniref:Pre-mRNA-splicing factor SLU7 n=1 Tax=Ficus carica TaxID=3494 RepID=A0AA88D3B0_FICCA|nr:hypothetical protein TIFTF001_010266 [Ficus carica]